MNSPAEPPSKLRVVFTGHTGLKKSSVLKRLCEYVETIDSGSKAAWYSAEKALRMDAFLDEDLNEQRRHWRESIRSAVDQWEDEKPDYAFLSLHLTYQRFSRTFLPLTWQIQMPQKKGPPEIEDSLIYFLGERFQPHYLVTLIDDIPFVQWRIQREGKYRMSLRQLFGWRELEILLTDYVAQQVISEQFRPERPSEDYPFERSPVVAIGHPQQMFFRLIAKPEVLRIYASFPIGSTRFRQNFREEIDRFRDFLHQEFAVFDPLTIDELPLEQIAKDNNQLDLMGGKTDYRALRWPLSNPLYGDIAEEVRVDQREANEVVEKPQKGVPSIVDDQIETRDYRLIQQADCVVTYRPQFRGDSPEPREDFSSGTGEEWDFATRIGKPRVLIHDPVEDGELNSRAFRSKAGMTPHRFDEVSNLNNPDNQKTVLEQVVEYLKNESSNFSQYRRQES